MATEPTEIVLTDDLKREIAALADRTGRPWADVLADALRSFRSPQKPGEAGESLYDSLARRGLIGCIEGGPPDLSTNPEYMEGFGTQ